MPRYSLFAPVHNEEGNLTTLYSECAEVMNEQLDESGEVESWELILINDGSTDQSLAEMRSIQGENLVIIDLKRNYGQAVAMDVGFRYARGDYIVSLDSDLQNDPRDIPHLLRALKDRSLDVIAGWRVDRKKNDPFWMLFITRVARFLRGKLINDAVHDSGCTLRAYRAYIVKDLVLWGEMHRYIIALLRWKGARISEMPVSHRARQHGRSKYNWKKSIKGFVDLVYIWFWRKFSNRPLHLFGAFGIILGFVGVISGLWTVYLKFAEGASLSESMWFILTFFLLIMAVQFFVFGAVLDLLIRTYYNSSAIENRYDVQSVEYTNEHAES
jgi:glycosyltransferase involved in cell wall biosynthesis